MTDVKRVGISLIMILVIVGNKFINVTDPVNVLIRLLLNMCSFSLVNENVMKSKIILYIEEIVIMRVPFSVDTFSTTDLISLGVEPICSSCSLRVSF